MEERECVCICVCVDGYCIPSVYLALRAND